MREFKELSQIKGEKRKDLDNVKPQRKVVGLISKIFPESYECVIIETTIEHFQQRTLVYLSDESLKKIQEAKENGTVLEVSIETDKSVTFREADFQELGETYIQKINEENL